jgi:hypothetical protein
MKSFFRFFIAVTLAIPTMATAITIDGLADTAYGSAIVTQQIGTAAGDNTLTSQGIANGSELDAAYGFVSNAVLYLVLAGNFDSDYPTSPTPNDELNIFFMTGPGGDHTLGTNYSGTFQGRINRMGVGGNGQSPGAPGLTFDTGFTPNHWIGVNVGPYDGGGLPITMFVDYSTVCSNCFGTGLGSAVATNLPPNNVLLVSGHGNLDGILVSLINSNTAGVDGTTCTTNPAGAAQSVAAAAVRTGVELAIPLAAIGSPTGQVKVCAFITKQLYDEMYNQVLGPVTGGAGFCTNSFGDPAFVDFSTLPGQNFFTLTVPPCDLILVNPSSASYTSTGGVGSVTAANSGGCQINVTTNASWLSVTSSSGLGAGVGNGSFTYSVAPNTNSINTRTGQFIITDTEGSGNIVTQTVTITQTGIPSPPLGIITVDGIAESTYGCPIAIQQLSTQFGDSTNGSLANAIGGSELDAAYGIIHNDVLFLVFAGNLEGNGNKLDIFLQTGPGGQNTLTNINPNLSNLPRMGFQGNGANTNPGLTFDANFAPNYCIIVNDFGGTCFVDYAPLWPIGVGTALTNGLFLGSSTPTNGTLVGGTNPFGIQVAINDSNTNGVHGVDVCNTNTYASGFAPGDVRTGIELAIPLSAIGSPTGAIAICAFVNSGDQTFLSNQVLPPIVTTNVPPCRGNLGESTLVNLNSLSGAARSFLVGPGMRVTSIAKAANNINVAWQTAVDTNLSYQLQRSSTLTTSVWVNVGSPTNGTGTVITRTDAFAATNKPTLFYRVKQITPCP